MSYPLNKLNEEERQVYTVIYQNKRIKQAEVARQTTVGSHDKYENMSESEQGSTKRKVRQIVRNLRLNHRIPIMSDNKGYFIAHRQDEAIEFMELISKRLTSQLVMYHTLKKMFDIECKEVEEQLKLFDLDQEEAISTLL